MLRLELLVAEPVFRQRADLEVLHQDVAVLEQLEDDRLPLGGRDVQRDRFLVAVDADEIGAFARAGHERGREAAGVVAGLGAALPVAWNLLRGRVEAAETGYWFGKHTYTYDIDAYIQYDLDAAIEFVLQQTGAQKINYIGHSMGGIIMYARLGTRNEGRIANLVTIASPMSFLPYNAWTFKLYRMRGGMAILPVLPLRPGAFIASFFPEALYAPFVNAFYNPENTDARVKAQLLRKSINNISKSKMIFCSK